MNTTKAVAFWSVLAAGAIHVLVADSHVQHMSIHGLFLVLLGCAQLGWAIAWLRWQGKLAVAIGMMLTGGIVGFWLLLFLIPLGIGGHLPQHVRTLDWALLVTKAAEITAFVALLWFVRQQAQQLTTDASGLRAVLPGLAITAGVSICLVLATILIDPIFPRLSSQSGWLSPAELISLLAPDTAPDQPTQTVSTYNWNLPAGFPVPRTPDDNPMTVAKVELGRRLFYDPRLSGNGAQSCSACHLQALAFSDGKVVPTGSTGQQQIRNSQALVNVAYNATLTWANPVLTEIERQVLIPLFGEFPVEMGVTGHEKEVLARLTEDGLYSKLFAAAFPEDPAPINFHNIPKALASFVRSLISGDSAYDRYLAGDKNALSPSARRGMDLFFSERFECHHCHTGFNFTASTVHSKSTFSASAFQNNGLYNLDGNGSYPRGNRGLFEITNEANDMGRFRPPTLRNIELTKPYMHDGSIATLEEVIRHYAAGGRVISEGEFAGDGRRNPMKSGLVPGFEISEQETTDLVNFLKSLTDRQFITNPAFSDPMIATSTP